MMKKIISIIVLISIIISFTLLFNWFMTTPEEVIEGEETEGEKTEEILSELDAGLLGEDDEIEIGEMI